MDVNVYLICPTHATKDLTLLAGFKYAADATTYAKPAARSADKGGLVLVIAGNEIVCWYPTGTPE